MTTFTTAEDRANQRNAVLAGFLGWTLDAFDFFILVFVLLPVAHDFGRSVPAVALTLTASLAMRPVGAFVFGLLADRYGRRKLLIWNILFYSAIEVLSGLAPTYGVFLVLRLLYGVGMGGEWGVGASLALESVPAKWRGVLSGMLQEGYAAGYLLAAVAYALIFPHVGWRVMFFVGGLPGLLSLFVIVKVKETEAWRAVADRLGHLQAGDLRQPEAIPLPDRADGHDELHLPRHPGHVPDVPAPAAAFQRARDLDHHHRLDGRGDCRRPVLRPVLGPLRAEALHGHGGAAGRARHSAVGAGLDARR